MSNGILFDPLLTRHLAEELDRRLRGRSCGATPIYRSDLSVLLALDRAEALRLDLHPRRGWIRVMSSAEVETGETAGVCAGVEHGGDERWISILIDVEDRFTVSRRVLTLELLTNQWNAVLHEDGAIVSVLRARQAGERSLHAGEPYVPPPGAPRFDPDPRTEVEARNRWMSTLRGLTKSEVRQELLREFAFVSALNVDWVLEPLREGASGDGEGGGDRGLASSFERWRRLCAMREAEPCVLLLPRGKQPYPFPLAGVPSEPARSLLEAMERVAIEESSAAPTDQPAIQARSTVARSLAAAERRRDRLREELGDSGETERLRAWGDLLLAHIGRIVRGDAAIDLEDWEGELVRIPLDPTLTPAENAGKYYDEARRRARAEARLPTLIEQAEKEAERWERALAAIDQGDIPAWVEDLLARSGERAQGRSPSNQAAPPYRRFRTSGGLEVRVGRSSRDNDRLTFRESAPNDVWLHARSVPGSHVILRWPHAEASPPARDLTEAAQLAAVFSRARTSSTVAVDWTRRKHVRKPRGAPPGSVVPQRVKTLFVEPDPAVVERLSPEVDEPSGGRDAGG